MKTPKDFQPTSKGLPNEKRSIDWVAPDGRQVNGGHRFGEMWFQDNLYVYYEPISWRYAVEG